MILFKSASVVFFVSLITIHSTLARQEEDAVPTAKKFISYSRTGLVDSALAMLTPETRKKVAEKMPYFLTFAHSTNLDSLRLLNTQWFVTADHSETQMLFDAPRDTGWVLFTVNVLKTGAGYRVQGFHFNVLSNEQYHSNDFDRVELTPAHLLILLYSLLTIGVIVLATVLCIRSRFRRKWLWILGFLVSFPTVCFNWTTSEISFEFVRFTLLGFAFSRYPLIAPWTLRTTFPLVAITFIVLWFYRRQRQKPGNQLDSSSTSVAA